MKAAVIQGDHIQILLVPWDGSLREARVLLSLDAGKKHIREVALNVTVERVRTPIKDLVMLVDEDGRAKNLPINHRAMMFYPGVIYGPALLTYERFEIDDYQWIGMPEGFDFGLVAEASYQRIVDSLGEHPIMEWVREEGA